MSPVRGGTRSYGALPGGNLWPPGHVPLGVNESHDHPSSDGPHDPGLPDDPGTSAGDGDEETLRRGPLWRHAVWVVCLTLVGVGLGWADASFRMGPDEFGMPLAVAGEVRPYLLTWTAAGLAVAAVLRAVAARVPLPGPEVFAVILTFMGTRLSLGWRPEPPTVGTMIAAALAAAAVWCVIGVRVARRGARGRGLAPEGEGGREAR